MYNFTQTRYIIFSMGASIYLLRDLNPFHGEVYSVHHYVIKFVSDLRQIDGFSSYSGFLHQ
jgi:hypothetical protein